MTFVCRFAKLHVAYARIFQNLLHCFLILIAHLDNDTRILCKQNLDEVLFLDFIQIDFHTAFHIGEAHFEQGSDKTTGRNVMSGKNQSLADQLLHGKKSIAEVFGILHAGNFIAHLTQSLSKGRTAEFQVVETEVYMIMVVFSLLTNTGETTFLTSDTSPPAETITVPGEITLLPSGYFVSWKESPYRSAH